MSEKRGGGDGRSRGYNLRPQQSQEGLLGTSSTRRPKEYISTLGTRDSKGRMEKAHTQTKRLGFLDKGAKKNPPPFKNTFPKTNVAAVCGKNGSAWKKGFIIMGDRIEGRETM